MPIPMRPSTVLLSAAVATLFFGCGDGATGADLEDGADPTIASDNVYEENRRNSVTFGQGLEPVPVPKVPDLDPSP